MVTRTWARAPRTCRQRSGGQCLAGEFDEGVAQPLAVGAHIAGGAVAVHDRLQGGVQVFPAEGVEVSGEVDPALRADGHPEHPVHPGGVVQGAVGVDAGHPAADGLRGVLRAQGAGGVGEHGVGGGQVDAVGRCHPDPGGGDRGGDQVDVGGGDRPGGVGGGQDRQVGEPPAGPQQRRSRRGRRAGSARSARSWSTPCRRLAARRAGRRWRPGGSAARSAGSARPAAPAGRRAVRRRRARRGRGRPHRGRRAGRAATAAPTPPTTLRPDRTYERRLGHRYDRNRRSTSLWMMCSCPQAAPPRWLTVG